MSLFKLKIQPRAFDDIQTGIDYYNAQQKGLGKRFYNAVKDSFDTIKNNPFFQIRYDDVRCLPIKKFPFMIHFVVNETNKMVNIYAVINTHLDPDSSWIL